MQSVSRNSSTNFCQQAIPPLGFPEEVLLTVLFLCGDMKGNNYIKHKRKLIIPPPGIMGFTYSHYFTEAVQSGTIDGDGIAANDYYVHMNISFVYPGSLITLHNNNDESIHQSFSEYQKKLTIIRKLATEALEHVTTGKGPKVFRDFLNDGMVNDGYGGTLFITADGDEPSNFCVFEISSCYKKYRHLTDPKGLKHYLKSLLAFMDGLDEDLINVKNLVDTHIKEKPTDGK